MTATKRTYETTILVKAADARADLEGTLAAVRQIYEAEGATFLELAKWDERPTAYAVKGEKSACYLIGYFEADPQAVEKIERRAVLGTTILRQLMVARPGRELEKIRTQRAKAAAAAAAAAAQPAMIEG